MAEIKEAAINNVINSKIEQKKEENKADIIIRIINDVKREYENKILTDTDIDALTKNIEKIKVVEEKPKEKSSTERIKESYDEAQKESEATPEVVA